MDGNDRIARKHCVGSAAGDAHARRDVSRRVMKIERRKLAAKGDALLQLAQLGLVEPCRQFGLADQRYGNGPAVDLGVRVARPGSTVPRGLLRSSAGR